MLEFIGTLVLTLFGCGSAAVSGGSEAFLVFLELPWHLACLSWQWLMLLGDVSGCHINPAVSLEVFLNKGMSFKDFVGYIVSSF